MAPAPQPWSDRALGMQLKLVVIGNREQEGQYHHNPQVHEVLQLDAG